MNQIAKEIRKLVIEVAYISKSPHVASALSSVDILSVLYYKILEIPNFKDPNRDIFILSKGHAAMALYATLYHKGVLKKDEFFSYFQNGGKLPAHLDRFSHKAIEVSAGSLGHGLPIGLGIAYSKKLKNFNGKVYILMGDGETQEGSVWESAMIAPKLKLNNLVVFIDRNNLQGYGRADELVSFEPIDEKFRKFNWEVFRVDGHNHKSLQNAIEIKTDKPKVIICDTKKGYGIDFMEDKLEWHYYIVTDEIRERALKALDEK